MLVVMMVIVVVGIVIRRLTARGEGNRRGIICAIRVSSPVEHGGCGCGCG